MKITHPHGGHVVLIVVGKRGKKASLKSALAKKGGK